MNFYLIFSLNLIYIIFEDGVCFLMIRLLILFIIIFYTSLSIFSIDVDKTIESTVKNNPKVKIGFEKLKESKELIENALRS